MKEITISELNQGQRVDKFVKKYLKDAPLSFIYKLFRIKDVKVNDKRIQASYILKKGDVVKIYVSDAQIADFTKPKEIIKLSNDFKIIYEDENILIVNKPSGLLVHGDEQEKRRTLANQILNYLYEKKEYVPNDSVGFIPAPCHRLDRNTSGLVVFAKNMESLKELEELFKNKNNLKKEYLALVAGKLVGDGKIDAPLYKNESTKMVTICPISRGGKKALTYYHSIETFSDCSLVRINIITGRTHQIRVHFASIKHPIMGDAKYGNFNINRRFEESFNYRHQFLHAIKLEFLKIEGRLSYLSNKIFVAPLFEKEENIINKLKENRDGKLF